ncbi:MAG TPA: TlpA disulfide reductase family protein [Agriterribacter sp.]|nr:TlpA disulfide reductase family protein [Agriterribacter sp.]
MIKKLTLLSVLAILCLYINAQPPAIKPLTIGDTVPDIVFHHVINYKNSTARLSDFKGKLVILDFWATWCGSCINAFPKMDSLQAKFNDKIQIMLINTEKTGNKDESENRVEEFYTKWLIKTQRRFLLPSSIQQIDTLRQLFPHLFIPHYVWISQDRKVIGITSRTEINAWNIETAINGLELNMPVKSDNQIIHDQN